MARSFSKDLGLAGERIGYLALHPELGGADAMAAVKFAQRSGGFVNASATMQRMLLLLDSWEVDSSDSAVRSALEVSDGYVWIYSERPKWWTNEMLPKAYVEALAKARKAEKKD